MSTVASERSQPRRSLGDRAREWLMLRSVRAIGPLQTERIELPGTATALRMRRPRPVAPDPERNPPYWTELWPSGVVLAGMVARDPGLFAGQRVLEIGPGIGVTAVAALQAGADLVVADVSPGALALCVLNARDQTAREPQTLWVNWRMPSPKLFDVAGKGFAIVLAADVLYEREDIMPLLRLLERVLAPGGELWLAEPGRAPAERFVDAVKRRGWSGWSEECDSIVPDPHDGELDVVTVHRLRRPQRGRA